jgi:hypothetical protein
MVVYYTDIEKGITVIAEKDYLLEQFDLFKLSEVYCYSSHEYQGSSESENTVIVDLMEEASEGSWELTLDGMGPVQARGRNVLDRVVATWYAIVVGDCRLVT